MIKLTEIKVHDNDEEVEVTWKGVYVVNEEKEVTVNSRTIENYVERLL